MNWRWKGEWQSVRVIDHVSRSELNTRVTAPAAKRLAQPGPDLRVEFVHLAREAQPLTIKSLVDKAERLRSRDELQDWCHTLQLADQQVQPR